MDESSAITGAMKIIAVVIASHLASRILEHAGRAQPAEACGLLFGTEGVIEGVQPTENVSSDPGRSFEIHPSQLLRAQRLGRSRGEPLIGWYHSHPNGSLLPSARDAACAEDIGRLWLIAADGRLAAYRCVADGSIEGRFASVELTVC